MTTSIERLRYARNIDFRGAKIEVITGIATTRDGELVLCDVLGGCLHFCDKSDSYVLSLDLPKT